MAATTATRGAWGVLEGTAGSGAPIEVEEGFSRRYWCAERRVKAEFRACRSVAGARPYVGERVARDRHEAPLVARRVERQLEHAERARAQHHPVRLRVRRARVLEILAARGDGDLPDPVGPGDLPLP